MKSNKQFVIITQEGSMYVKSGDCESESTLEMIWRGIMKGKIDLQKLLWHGLPIIGLLIWGALSVTSYLWYDEAYSAALVAKDVKGLIEITSKDVHSPFYYMLLKGFYHLCGGGTNYWSLKVFSLLFSFGYLLLGKYWVKNLYDQKTSIYFMFFSILMPILTVQATNVRMYSCGLFFMTATGLCMLEIYRKEERITRWIAFALFSVCSVYCHTFQMIETLLLFGFFFMALIWKKQYKKLRGFFSSGIFVAILYLPWLKITYQQMQTRMVQTAGDVAAAPESDTRFQALIIYAKEWFSAGETPFALVMYLGMALAIVLGYFAVDYMRDRKDYTAGLGILAIIITTLVGTYLNNYVAACFMGRYVFAVFGALALLYALGIQQIRNKWLKAGVLLVALYCFGVQYKSELKLEYQTEIEKYYEFVEQNVGENDVIMTSEYYMMMLSVYYPELRYMAYGHKDEWMPFCVNEVFTAWEQLEDLDGTLWFIGKNPDALSQEYDYEEALKFHHMYYDFFVYKMVPKLNVE